MHDIAQAEGVEQGDPLARGLYALGQHDSLVAASASLRPDERLAAFLAIGIVSFHNWSPL